MHHSCIIWIHWPRDYSQLCLSAYQPYSCCYCLISWALAPNTAAKVNRSFRCEVGRRACPTAPKRWRWRWRWIVICTHLPHFWQQRACFESGAANLTHLWKTWGSWWQVAYPPTAHVWQGQGATEHKHCPSSHRWGVQYPGQGSPSQRIPCFFHVSRICLQLRLEGKKNMEVEIPCQSFAQEVLLHGAFLTLVLQTKGSARP